MTPRALARLFLRERAAFARHYPHVAGAGLELSDAKHTPGSPRRPRDVAYADLERGVVVVLARALAWPRANLVGLVRHELGHLADPLVDEDGAEGRADAIAAAVRGDPIRYDAHDRQTIGCGGARPKYLHQ